MDTSSSRDAPALQCLRTAAGVWLGPSGRCWLGGRCSARRAVASALREDYYGGYSSPRLRADTQNVTLSPGGARLVRNQGLNRHRRVSFSPCWRPRRLLSRPAGGGPLHTSCADLVSMP